MRVTICFILGLFQAGASQSTDSPLHPIAPYYRPAELFDQSRVLKSEKHADYLRYREGDPSMVWYDPEVAEKTFKDDLVHDFFKKRRAMYSKAFIQQFVVTTGLLPIIVPIFIFGMVTGSQAITIFALTTAVLAIVYDTRQIRSLVSSWMFSNTDPLLPYEVSYALKKHELNYLDRDCDERRGRDGLLGTKPELMLLAARQSMAQLSEPYKYLRTYLSVPTRSIRPTYSSHNFAQTFAPCGPQVANKITVLCANHAYGYTHQLGVNPHGREFITLISEPGMGKTRAVEMIAKLLGLPYARLDICGVCADDLLGTEDKPGLLLNALIELGARNGILFVDEMPSVVNNQTVLSTVLNLFDPSRKVFYSKYLERYVDISHLLIIGAGNEDFTNSALLSRFHPLKTIRFMVDPGVILDRTLGAYLDQRLTSVDRRFQESMRLAWRSEVDAYLKTKPPKEGPPSHRDAQAKLDLLLGEWRAESLV